MAKTAIDIQNTFQILNESGAKSPGTLAVSALANFIETGDPVLFRFGLMDFAGGNNTLAGKTFNDKQGATIRIPYPINDTVLKEVTDFEALTYSKFKVRYFDLHFDKPILAQKWDVFSIDQLLWNQTQTLSQTVFNDSLLRAYKGLATLYYKNLLAHVKAGNQTIQTIATIKANPALFFDWLESKVIPLTRKVDKYTSAGLSRDLLICIIKPELMNAIHDKLGELGRTIEFIKGERYNMFKIKSVLVVEDKELGANRASGQYLSGASLSANLTKFNAVLLSRRVQPFLIGAVEMKQGEKVDWKDKILSYRVLYTYGINPIFNDEAYILKEIA